MLGEGNQAVPDILVDANNKKKELVPESVSFETVVDVSVQGSVVSAKSRNDI